MPELPPVSRWHDLVTSSSGEILTTACQVMKGDMMSKIFLDLDDSGCPTLADAEAKTKEMMEWATVEV